CWPSTKRVRAASRRPSGVLLRLNDLLLLGVGGGRRRRLLLGSVAVAGLLLPPATPGSGDLLWLDDRQVDLGVLAVGRALDHDGRARRELGLEDEVGQRVLDVALDRPAQRARSHRGVPALVDEQVLRVLRELELQLALGQRLADAAQEELHDGLDLVLRELVEDDDLVDAVEELWAEH